jgi:hypothetical protein
MNLSKLQKWLALIIAIASIGGTAFGVERYFAKDSEVKLLAQRLDQKVVSDQIYYMQRQLWSLQDRYNQTRDPAILQQIRELEHQIKMLELRLKKGSK